MDRKLQRAFVYVTNSFLWALVCALYAGIIAQPLTVLEFPELYAAVVCIAWFETVHHYQEVHSRYCQLRELKQQALLGYYDYREHFQITFDTVLEILWALSWLACERLLPRLICVFGLLYAGITALSTENWQLAILIAGVALILTYFLPQFFHQLFSPTDLKDIVKNQAHYKQIMGAKRYRENPPSLDEYREDGDELGGAHHEPKE